MTDDQADRTLPLSDAGRLDALRGEFERASLAGAGPRIEDFLRLIEEPLRPAAFRELLKAELALRRTRQETIAPNDYLLRFPDWQSAVHDAIRNAAEPGAAAAPSARPRSGLHVRCPHCRNPIELVPDAELESIQCRSCGSNFSLTDDSYDETRDARSVAQVGHFKLIERLGMGAFGTVWKAQDVELDRTVAIKIPRTGQLDKQRQDFFFREARSAAQLRHPNIVPVYEVGREGDTLYIVSEFVRGLTLADRLSAGPLPAREAAQLCATIADALHHAHEQGVIHRDLKPANVMLDEQGQPHLMDFGLARREAHEITMTLEGQVLGTPAYMSPEQAQGDAHAADGRSDVYSLGVMLFEMLTGELPFRGNARMMIHQVIHDDPPNPRKLNGSVPRDLDTLAMKCLEKAPARRFPTAREFADELRRHLAGEPIRSRPITVLERGWRWCRRHKAAAALIALAAIAGPAVAIREAAMRSAAEKNEQAAVRAQSEAKIAEQLATEQAEELAKQLYIINLPRAVAALRDGRSAAARELLAACPESQRAWEWKWLARRAGLVNKQDFRGRQRVLFLPSGDRVVAVRADDETILEIRSAKSGELLRRFPPTEHLIKQICLSPDGAQIAVGTEDGTVSLWRASDGERLWTVKAHDQRSDGLAFSPDGARLASTSWDGGLIVFNAEDGRRIAEGRVDDELRGAAFDPTGARIVTASRNDTGKLRLWDAADAALVKEFAPPEVPATRVATFNPAGDAIVAGGFDGVVRFHSPVDGQLILELPKTPDVGHSDTVHALAFSPDGARLSTAASDGKTCIWNPLTGDLLAALDGAPAAINFVSYSPDGDVVATADAEGQVSLWAAAVGETESTYLIGLSPYYLASGVAFSPDGQRILASNGIAKVFDATTMTETTHFSGSHYNARFTPHGDTFASIDGDRVCIYDSKGGDLLHALPHESANSLAVSPDGRILASGGRDRTVRIWGAMTGAPLCVLPYPEPGDFTIWDIDFHPKGKQFASATTSHGLRIWDAETFVPLTTLDADGLWCVKYSPDGSRIVAGGEDRTIHVWDASTLKELPPFSGTHAGRVNSLAFSPDGTRLVSADDEGMINLWDAKSGVEMLTLRDADGVATSHVRFSPNGRTIAAGRMGAIVLWECETPPGGYAPRRRLQMASDVAASLISSPLPLSDILARIDLRSDVDAETKSLAATIWSDSWDQEVERLELFREAAESHDAGAAALNDYAWKLLTIVPVGLRDPAKALPIAERAVALSDGNYPSILDTLSLAYYETGDFASAVETQERAVALLPEDSAERPAYVSRLEAFQAAMTENSDQ